MKWPLRERPIPYKQIPLYNRQYLFAPLSNNGDPTLVMGTDIDADALQSFLRERNNKSRVLITTAHALIRATAMALEQFPEMNVRVVGHRIYGFRDVNVRIAFFHRQKREIDVMMIRNANLKGLEQIGQEIWQRLLEAGRGEGRQDYELALIRMVPSFLVRPSLTLYAWLDRLFPLPTVGRLDAMRAAAATVNDLSFSFAGAPPIRSYKPSRFPDESDSINLTLGPAEDKVVARSGQFVSTRVMPLFMRADHRLVDAYQVARFLAVVRSTLNHPEQLDLVEGQPIEKRAYPESPPGPAPDGFTPADKLLR
jgi:chloramphenicol O-acetyltransferase